MDSITFDETVDLDRARALAALLDLHPARPLRAGDVLPPMWQVAYFLPRPPQRELGPDGHPSNGFPTPPAPGLRRMFAGGRLTCQPGLVLGRAARATTTLLSSTQKTGRSGRLAFATSRTEVTQDDSCVLVEERDIVYLAAAPTSSGPTGRKPLPVDDADATAPDRVLDVEIDPTLLFRFSALTYNAHRIHYDRDYARDVEGYPGLVVHGPLQALLIAQLGHELQGDGPFAMSYRLHAPLFEDDGLRVTGRLTHSGVALAVVDATGRVTASGVVTAPDRRAAPSRSPGT